MPRKKKNGSSPGRVAGLSNETVSTSVCHRSLGGDQVVAINFPSGSLPNYDKEKVITSMQEMFSHLDPEVIYIVLSECDFKVENAMDSLLELSGAAEGAASLLPRVSGFERTAATLLKSHSPEFDLGQDSSLQQNSSCPSPDSPLTEEFDMLIDQIAQAKVTDEQESYSFLSAASSLSSFPPPPFLQEAPPMLLQEPGFTHVSEEKPHQRGLTSVEQTCGGYASFNQINLGRDVIAEGQHSTLDHGHLNSEMPTTKPNPPPDLGASGRPSAFQIYRKQDQASPSEGAAVTPLSGMIAGARSKSSMSIQQTLTWNMEAPEFCPREHGNQGPAFITPVAQSPFPMSTPDRPAHHWLSQGPTNKPPLKLSATVPKSWVVPTNPAQGAAPHIGFRLEGKVLVLLRGAPGSGKSTLARTILEDNPGGAVFSTDDYFCQQGEYHYDPSVLGIAHEWNHRRAKEAFQNGISPIIIDNTNLQGWEMKPYVTQALRHKYKVLFREPHTWWKNKPRELERKTKHAVPVGKIRHMLDGYERSVSVKSIMGSHVPEWKDQESRPVSSEQTRPDLVQEPGMVQASEMPHPQLLSSLPDISSVELSRDMEPPQHDIQDSDADLSVLSERVMKNPIRPNHNNKLSSGAFDSELDAQLEIGCAASEHGIPDCIVESVINQDYRDDQPTVAFSESISQRVKRQRQSRRSDQEKMPEPLDLVKDTTHLKMDTDVTVGQERKEDWTDLGAVVAVEGEGLLGGAEGGRPELLDFVGDWPSEGSLEQREQGRWRVRHSKGKRKQEGAGTEEMSHHGNGKETESQSDVAFQTFLDLIQRKTESMCASSTSFSTPPQSSGDGGEGKTMDKEAQTMGRANNHNSDGDNDTITEILDCATDWKAADLPHLNKPQGNTFESTAGETRDTERITREGRDSQTSLVGAELDSVSSYQKTMSEPLSDPTVESDNPHISEITVGHDNDGTNCGIDGEAEMTNKEIMGKVDPSFTFEAYSVPDENSCIGEASQSPLCDVSGEAESSFPSSSSQERKQRQSRRCGKPCKLALTFTQNYPSSPIGQNLQKNYHDKEQHNQFSPVQETDLRLNTKPNFDPYSEVFSKLDPQSQPQPLSPTLTLSTGSSTQTDPQDFALLWRVNHQDSLNDTFVVMNDHSGDIRILSGSPSRFQPELAHVVSAAVAVCASGHSEVPYRVVHEKGTQVEEKELVGTKSKLESLRILSRHFKLVSFDTLEDLYDKCHQDLEWTTNLLLDSGERFFRDEDSQEGEEGEEDSDRNLLVPSAFPLYGRSDIVGNAGMLWHTEDKLHSEDEGDAEPPGCMDAKKQESADEGSCSAMADLPVGAFSTDVGSAKGLMECKKELGSPGRTEEDQGGFGFPFSGPLVSPRDGSGEGLCSTKSPQPLVNVLSAVEEEDEAGTCKQEVTLETFLNAQDSEGRESPDDSGEPKEPRREIKLDEISQEDEMTQLLLAQLVEVQRREEELMRKEKDERRSRHLDIHCLELKLPTELAIQLTELFGPVGIDPGACSSDEFAVQIDLNLAKLLHLKWKETIQQRQRQDALSYRLLQESSTHWVEPQSGKPGVSDGNDLAHFLTVADSCASLSSQSEARRDRLPFMDHWGASRPHVSLRNIMSEELALQVNMEKTRQSRSELDRRDGATLLKEQQLYAIFPTIDRHFLKDIFRDHNYCLVQTEQFLHSLLDEAPVKNVVAPESPRCGPSRSPSRERDKKSFEPAVPTYQNVEDPAYKDFRAEANMHRERRHESFSKAAEAFKQGRKDVASFYAQQGHLHGRCMQEANHRAAMQIFASVNASLLPSNILDLHGLHVDEALHHLSQILRDKAEEYQQGKCGPQLSVITGRGNHSQGGVARIRPAVIDYLKNKQFRFTEPKQGLLLVSLNSGH